MIKAYIITGPESSGSVFISKVLAYALGATKNIDDWDGYGHCKSVNPNIKVLHRSQPYCYKDQYCNLKQFREEFKNMDLYFVLTTRYHAFSNISKSNRFNRTNEDIMNNAKESRIILSEIIKSGEKYFIWNYETMLYLKEVYFDLLYKFIGSNSKYYPQNVSDGNIKYVKK